MTLHLKNLTLRSFRNYPFLFLEDLGPLTVFAGENAVGKTNVIEGIQLLTALSSFRRASTEQLIAEGEEKAQLVAEVTDENRHLEVRLSLCEKTRSYTLNGKLKKPADLRGLVPAVTFTPDDLNLVKGSPAQRRGALDALGVQVNKSYAVLKRDYEKVVRYKNKLLKEEPDPLLVDSINETLVICGSQFACYRAALFSRLVPNLVDNYSRIAKGREALSARYVPSWEGLSALSSFNREEARELFSAALAKKGDEERRRGRCLVGPHLDEIAFEFDNRPASQYGSQGQQRTVVLAFKLAEAKTIEDVLGQKPILLLDDVMSELDGSRRETLVDLMSEGTQAFVTTANLAYFDKTMLNHADVVSLPLKDGVWKR